MRKRVWNVECGLRSFILVSCILLGVAKVSAQDHDEQILRGTGQEGVTRSITITRDYLPTVERATKIDFKPMMNDTARLDPNLSYVVKPHAWGERFAPIPMDAMQPMMQFDRLNPLYVKIGGGYPGQSVLDAYLTSRRPGAAGMGVFVIHRGQWAPIDGVDATSTMNTAGVFGRFRMGGVQISGEVAADYNLYRDYLTVEQDNKRTFTMPRASLDVMHRWVNAGGDGYYLMTPERNESGGTAFAQGRYKTGWHNFALRLAVDGWQAQENKALIGSDKRLKIDNMIAHIVPQYIFNHSQFRYVIGVDVAYEKTTGEVLYVPDLELRMQGVVSPYARLTGAITANNYRSLMGENPYMSPEFHYDRAPGASTRHTVLGGVSGHIGEVAELNVYGGLERLDNAMISLCPEPVFAHRMESVMLGLDMDLRTRRIEASLEAKWQNYTTYKAYKPNLTGKLDLAYTHEKWSVGLGVEVNGKYKFYIPDDRLPVSLPDSDPRLWPVSAPPGVDVSLRGQYTLSSKLSIFVEGENLADQKIYRFAAPYRAQGIGVSAGVKLKM